MHSQEPGIATGSSGNTRFQTQTRPPFNISFNGKRHHNTRERKKAVAENPRVLCESAVCDLALVTVSNDSFWTDLPAVRFQEKVPDLDDTVVAVGDTFSVTCGDGDGNLGFTVLASTDSATPNSDSDGALAFTGGQILGLLLIGALLLLLGALAVRWAKRRRETFA